MENIESDVGKTFGRLTVLRTSGAKGGKWLCACECGNQKIYARNSVAGGHTLSCGCLRVERAREAVRRSNSTHGMTRSTEFRIWTDMRRRCTDSRRPDFKNYGARGITVCKEWSESFENFYRDMGPRPSNHTLDRLNNSGPYAKWNCVWASRKAQERNKRTNRIIEIDGRRMTVAEACETYGIAKATAENRLNTLKWSVDDTFKKPIAYRGKPRPKKVA